MKKAVMLAMLVVVLAGCGGIRLAATEGQKQNAWVHWRTCEAAEQVAKEEAVSEPLGKLTGLVSQQSEAFVLDYGLPKEMPAMESVDAMLADGPGLAVQAATDAQRRVDVWTMADAAMELGVGIAGLLGGVYGLRIAVFLKQAREKSSALKEIVAGNELFKQLCPTAEGEFKQAHANQSAATKGLVTEIKAKS